MAPALTTSATPAALTRIPIQPQAGSRLPRYKVSITAVMAGVDAVIIDAVAAGR